MPTSNAISYNLPLQLTSFIGREKELAAVTHLLSKTRLLTLTGTGGCGKTRLALQLAESISEEFQDGVYFVSLTPITDPLLVVSTIAQVLGLREQRNHLLVDSLKDYLRDKQILLLVDNFEQVISSASVINELLKAAPGLKALVTSRVPLHLSGEQEFIVNPFPLPDLKNPPPSEQLTQFEAVRLFIDRAKAIKSDFSITADNALVIAAICTQLEGLPLAIELAAGRIKLFSLEELLSRLRRRLKLLVGGARDMPLRQQTLRGTLEWSYNLLEEPEQSLFRRLAVFVGSFTLEAVEIICNARQDLGEEVLDTVERLVAHSLLLQEISSENNLRFKMLETVREFALEQLEKSGEAEKIKCQHATFFFEVAVEAELKIQDREQLIWYKRLEAEHDNLRAALNWTLSSREVEIGLRLAGSLFGFWRSCNHTSEGRSWLERLLTHSDTQKYRAARAKALMGAGALAFFMGELAEAQVLLEESIRIGQEVGPENNLALPLAVALLAHVNLVEGKPALSATLAEESRELYKRLENTWGVAMALFVLGKATIALNDPLKAYSLLRESSELFRMLGDRHRLVLPLDSLGSLALLQEDFNEARVQFEEALLIAREMGDKQFEADVLAHLGSTALNSGDPKQAGVFYQQSLRLNQVLGNKQGITTAQKALVALDTLDKPLEPPLPTGEVLPSSPPYTKTKMRSQGEPLEKQPGGLTLREIQVAQLVAQGKSNRTIAGELVVGVGTVEAHISHIFSKLGFTSRAQIAVWVVENRLARVP